jgi:phage-related protein
VDDEVIQSGLNMLLTFKNIRNEVGANNDIFTQSSKALLDMAAGMAAASGGEVDLKAASIQLGKALNDPVLGMTALTRVGVQFSAEQQKSIAGFVKHNNILGAQKVILAELTSQFQGSAKANATASATMGVAFENLAEIVGRALAPAITALLTGLTSFAEFLQTNVGPALQAVQAWFQKVWAGIQPVVEIIGSVLVPVFTKAAQLVMNNLVPALRRLWTTFGPVLKIVGLVLVAFMAWQAFMIGALVIAISLVIDWLSRLVQGFMAVVNFVRDKFVEPIVNAFARVIDAIGKVVGWVKDKLLGAWQAIEGPVLAVINAIISAVETLVGWIKTAIDFLSQLGQGVSQELGGQVGDILPPGFGSNMPGMAGLSAAPVELHLHGDVANLVERVDQALAGKARRNVRLAHHGRD